YRDIKSRIIKKTKSLARNVSEEERINLLRAGETGLFLTERAQNTTEIKNESVQLTVTSPPFLDVVQYSTDNWLRCWFNGIDENEISKKLTVTKNLDEWKIIMKGVFTELYRITKHGGWVAFEVGEVKKGTIKLEEHVVPLGLDAGFNCMGILINMQKFTKTANIWGIKSNIKGTNTNRVVIFRKK
ncbi:MAG: site-specific DNA-methyltransferase, partial [Candidatus Heimdallarchaeota archaeon]|nr:site-specific DNA-methyltransferase [Candidatus Heimdallarchaeota archaeon]